ncbi:ABC transporter ATP-binding protein/permease [Flavobacteriales bacterium]|nr:ABC transporter ATP-binding protein/permease [Flavobacteriales bacterium]
MKPLFYLNKYLWKYKWHLLFGLFFITASNYFGVYMPKIIDNAVDELIDYKTSTNKSNEVLWDLGLKLVFTYMLFSLLKGLFLFFTRQSIIVMSRKIEFDLKNEIFSKYQELSISFYKKNKTGDLMNRISEDVTKVRMYLGPAIMYSINVSVLFIMVISFMIYKNLTLTLYVLFPLPILSFIIYKVSSIINKKSEITQQKQSKITSFVQEAFSGIRVLKAYNKRKYFLDVYKEETNNYKQASLDLALVNSLFLPTIIFLIGLSTVITIYLGGIKTIQKELDYGDIVQFIFYINMLTWPFASIGWVSSLVQRAAASQKRINEFIKIEEKVINNGVKKLKEIKEIEFKNVSFKYPSSSDFVLKNINFKLSSGMTIGIFGKTGCGKSSLAQILCRLYEINSGEILINGSSVNDIKLSDFRKKIGYVPQDVFLFSDTIKNNIAFGLNKTDYEFKDVQSAAKKAGLSSEIENFSKSYETKIGERGVTLSGGQKQRISIARALARNPQLLIFDDCLSAVDSETSKKIQKSLNVNKSLAIHISHKISNISHCDHIIVLENGQISEEGNHNKLVNKKGFYYEIFKKQQIEEN